MTRPVPPTGSSRRRGRAVPGVNPSRRASGLSLVELLIGVVLSVVVIGAAVRVLIALIGEDRGLQAEISRKEAIAPVLGLMQEEIRNAQRIERGSLSSPLSNIDSSNCTTANVQTVLILHGRTANETISYGLLARATDNAWRGPAVLMRCGALYNADGRLNAGSPGSAIRSEQVLLDSVQATGFSATTLGGTNAISRNVELVINRDAGGTALESKVQVPISTNQVYGLGGSSDCRSGCPGDGASSKHYKPLISDPDIAGDPSVEDVVYFDGNRSEFELKRTPGSGICTSQQCTVQRGSDSITITNVDVLIFKDMEIRL